jgi:hypothetical protein
MNRICLSVVACVVATRALAFSPVFTDEFFLQECLWVGDHIGLDIGNDRGPNKGWAMRGTATQRDHKITVTLIVMDCERQVQNESDERIPVAQRACETREIATRNAEK